MQPVAEPKAVPFAPLEPALDRETARSAPPPVIVRRGLSPALAAAGVAMALVAGFAGGRVTAPRGESAPAFAAATSTATSTALATAIETQVAAATAEATQTEVPAAPTATEVAIVQTPPPAPSPSAVSSPVPTATATSVASAERTPTPKPVATKPPAPAVTLADVLALRSAGKHDEMTAALEKLVKQDPSNGEAHWMLAMEYRARKKGPKGCAEFRAYTKSAPGGEHAAEAKRHLAICRAVELLDKEKLDEAYDAFAAIVKSNYMFADGHYWLGTMQALKNENAAACASFKSYLRLDGQGPYSDRASAQLAALGC